MKFNLRNFLAKRTAIRPGPWYRVLKEGDDHAHFAPDDVTVPTLCGLLPDEGYWLFAHEVHYPYTCKICADALGLKVDTQPLPDYFPEFTVLMEKRNHETSI
jgi:hypothetical protein